MRLVAGVVTADRPAIVVPVLHVSAMMLRLLDCVRRYLSERIDRACAMGVSNGQGQPLQHAPTRQECSLQGLGDGDGAAGSSLRHVCHVLLIFWLQCRLALDSSSGRQIGCGVESAAVSAIMSGAFFVGW